MTEKKPKSFQIIAKKKIIINEKINSDIEYVFKYEKTIGERRENITHTRRRPDLYRYNIIRMCAGFSF